MEKPLTMESAVGNPWMSCASLFALIGVGRQVGTALISWGVALFALSGGMVAIAVGAYMLVLAAGWWTSASARHIVLETVPDPAGQLSL